MTDIPILFRAPMVLALLSGQKVQTRRILRRQPICAPISHDGELWDVPGDGTRVKVVPPWKVGDRLWVRETFRFHAGTGSHLWDGNYEYRADGSVKSGQIYSAEEWKKRANYVASDRWRPSIHMPRYVSRMTLIVEDVKVEELQNISPADIEAEGVAIPFHHRGALHDPHRWRLDHWKPLWEESYGPGSYADNPWVAAACFRVVHENIDKMPKDRIAA